MTNENTTTPPPAPKWYLILAWIVRLIWPLAILAAAVTLHAIGASAWFILLLVVACSLFARPPKFNWE